jgi:hypothetical protein
LFIIFVDVGFDFFQGIEILDFHEFVRHESLISSIDFVFFAVWRGMDFWVKVLVYFMFSYFYSRIVGVDEFEEIIFVLEVLYFDELR